MDPKTRAKYEEIKQAVEDTRHMGEFGTMPEYLIEPHVAMALGVVADIYCDHCTFLITQIEELEKDVFTLAGRPEDAHECSQKRPGGLCCSQNEQ